MKANTDPNNCPAQKPPRRACRDETSLDLAAYRERAEAYTLRMYEARYRALVGEEPSSDPEELMAGHVDLFSDDAICALCRLGEQGDRAARRLAGFAVENALAPVLAPYDTVIAERLRSTLVRLPGDLVPLPEMETRIRSADSETRERLLVREAEVWDRVLGGVLLERREVREAHLRRWGWPSWEDFVSFTTGASLQTAQALSQSLSPRQVPDAGTEGEEPSSPARVRELQRALQDAGIDPWAQGRLRWQLVDDGPSWCAVRSCPESILLRVSRSAPWRHTLHEAGHALHLAYTSAELPFEDRYLGDPAVLDGVAEAMVRCLDPGSRPTFLTVRLAQAEAELSQLSSYAEVQERVRSLVAEEGMRAPLLWDLLRDGTRARMRLLAELISATLAERGLTHLSRVWAQGTRPAFTELVPDPETAAVRTFGSAP